MHVCVIRALKEMRNTWRSFTTYIYQTPSFASRILVVQPSASVLPGELHSSIGRNRFAKPVSNRFRAIDLTNLKLV